MSTVVGNPLLAPLLASCSEQRRQWIASQLSNITIPFILLPFTTVLTTGHNLFVPPCSSSAPALILVAHYDGDTAQDNAGGVWLTLQLLQQFWQSSPQPLSLAALFTDQEETFQQGATSFIKHHLRSPNSLLTPHRVLCIDGFGAGNQVTLRHHTSPLIHLGHYFRMDADVFREAGFATWTLHSGLDCVQPAQGKQTLTGAVGDLNFTDERLYDLKEEAIAQFLCIYQALP